MSPRVAVDAVITLLVWDAHEATSRLCECVKEGVSRRASWHLLILDQGSAEPTATMLSDFAARMGPAVTLDRIGGNIGYPAGHNRLHRIAAERFDSRYLVTINSDVVFDDPSWLDTLVDFMDVNADVGIAGPTGVTYERVPPHRLGWCRLATAEEMKERRFDAISGSVCVIRQRMIEQIGLFDEAFTPGYYEDTDLTFRAKATGWRIALCDVPHRHHDLGSEKSTTGIKQAELAAQYGNFQKRNRDLFVERWLTASPRRLAGPNMRRLFPTVYVPNLEGAKC
ncbi:MAG: glycosyltransferase [Phycisphaerae bacterium]|nr:glycosyltransferase [Phycisphaerae bacterium]